jgi:hypothetical protein
MPATALSRGRILNNLEIILEDLQILSRHLTPHTDIEGVRQFNGQITAFITAIQKVLSHRKDN